MTQSNYIAIIEREEGGGYHAFCPALRGCHSQGETYEETIQNITEAIQLYIESLKAHVSYSSIIQLCKPDPNLRPDPIFHTHIVNAARAIMLDGAGLVEVFSQLLVPGIMSAAFLALAAALFRWD